MAACRAGSHSLPGICTGPPPTLDGTSSQAHQLGMSLNHYLFLGNGEGDVMYAEEILQPQLKAFPKVLKIVEIWVVLSHFANFQQGGLGLHNARGRWIVIVQGVWVALEACTVCRSRGKEVSDMTHSLLCK